MPRNSDMVDVVHRGPPDPPVIPLEAHRFDQVHRRSKACAEPQDRAYVTCNLRLEECDAHPAVVEVAAKLCNQ